MNKQRVTFCYCHFNNNNNSSELLLFIYLVLILLVAHVKNNCIVTCGDMYTYIYTLWKGKIKMWSLTVSLPRYQIKIIV